ncbi:MAG: efflux system, outer rane lipoprotein NodT family [Bryobacterales bacterium]|nr:efflux system, outer rane lipoprotein NodT family [Bryobacterales bacterium]
MNLRLAVSVACMALLSGCMVGPKYKQPSTPVPPAFKEQPPESFKESDGWKRSQPADQVLHGKRWELFGDSKLTELEEQVTISNQDLKAAEARFREARAMIRFNRASQFPTITVGPSISSLRASAHRPFFGSTSSATGDFVLPFDLSYELDVWGRVRRTVAAAREEAQASAADLETVRLSLQAELAFDYFELRAADAQKQLLDDTVKAYADALKLTTNRYEGGAAPRSDVAQAKTQLASTQSQDTDVGVQRAQLEHAIAVLAGKPPADFSLPPAPLDAQPPIVPIGLPSQLLERRPDIAAAERRVAEGNEQIGIARAAFFPTLMLGASAGLEGTSLLNWFNWPSRFWAVGPSMVQTLFDAGRRRATSEAALASYDALVANYRETALTAFQQVEDNLAALRILEQESKQQRDAVAAAEESLRIFTNRYKGGLDTYLSVITAQTATLTNQRTEVDIRRRRMDASVLLIKALGGGWDTTSLPKF